ncbi:MAG: preprotein translocase subunit SecA [Candidatus Taylorbacteria bacterium]|nr:preprotein translocase subunit SecA [Candidatus Taylorbacteria bacterium]
MGILKTIFPSYSARQIKRYKKTVLKINELEASIQKLSDAELRSKTKEFQDRIVAGESLDTILPEAFAVVREASRRTLGQRHYDVQLIGGMILHEGKIAEMKTGEGKTLMATLACYLNALAQKGVHVITVNDYLARRDATWMGQIYNALGLSVGVINDNASYIFDISHIGAKDIAPEELAKKEKEADEKEDVMGSFKVGYEFLKPSTKREAYHADITYGTNNQFGFDYLRDNIEHNEINLSQRAFYYAIVDEVDSILIDEARTPLIISAPTSDSENLYHTFADIAKQLEKDKHFTIDEKFKTIAMTSEGIDLAEKLLGVSNIYTEGGIKYVHHLETAVRAKALYNNDVEYIVKGGEVMIVDPSTGRLQPGRRWSEGLHQAIEAKEGVKVQKESRTYASITFQNYFRMYPKLAGMTGTGVTSSEEFLKVYGLDVIEVPTHRPVQRIDRNDLIFRTEKGKFMAITKKIKELNQKGQPVLVGTVSIEKNQLLSEYLKKAGVPHTLLNAKPEFAEREGEIVAEAGKRGAVTIATNMAGRGVDIKLGGAPSISVSKEEQQKRYEEIKSLGGLYVIGTERHEARRIDNQLRGRSGRQGDPGETQFYVSMEDDLMRIFASDTIKKMMGRLNIPEDEPIGHSLISRSLESAQTKIEGFHFDSRRHVLEYDDVLNQQRLKVYKRRKEILLGNPEQVEVVLNTILLKASEVEKRAIAENRKKIEELSGDTLAFLRTARGVMLQTIDLYWIDHLEFMDYMRSSVNLRAYGQRDPLVEYKREGLRLFRDMEVSVDAEIIRILAQVQGEVGGGQNVPVIELKPDADAYISGDTGKQLGEGEKPVQISSDPKVGRNDPCPCGSGKKYKKCHGA